jgi:hypothetical protein
MGGGNAGKSAATRAKKLAKEQSAGKSSDGATRKAQEDANNAIQCKVCMMTFMKTVRKTELEQHLDSKHAKLKKTLAEAFPGFTE